LALSPAQEWKSESVIPKKKLSITALPESNENHFFFPLFPHASKNLNFLFEVIEELSALVFVTSVLMHTDAY
jgi:hypothetical protein